MDVKYAEYAVSSAKRLEISEWTTAEKPAAESDAFDLAMPMLVIRTKNTAPAGTVKAIDSLSMNRPTTSTMAIWIPVILPPYTKFCRA